jgi:APA family basic amino acid/polyamine antiporter
LAAAFINAFFSFGGWWEVTKVAGEVKNPERTLPRALLAGIAAVTVVYLALTAAFLYVVPISQVASNTAFVAQFGEALFGFWGAKILAAGVLVSVVGGLTALMLAAPRVYYAMAQDGVLFARFARVHPRYGTPAQAIVLQLTCALLALLMGRFDQIIAYVIFPAVAFLALTAAAVFRDPSARRAWWYPLAPLLFIVCCAAVALMIALHNPVQAAAGALVVGSGAIAYALVRTAGTKSETPVPPRRLPSL